MQAIIDELSIKFEIILVNDASVDNTKAVINNLAKVRFYSCN